MTAVDISTIESLRPRDYANEKKLHGKVSDVRYSTDAFTIGSIYCYAGSVDTYCPFTAPSCVAIGEEITLHGTWSKHAKYGWQFVAKLLEYPMPDTSTSDGLASYLANNPAFKGLGPAKAKLIAEAFGNDFDRMIREEPERLIGPKLLTGDQVQNLRSEWTLRSDLNAISTWLAGFGLTHTQIKKIAEKYGNQAKPLLEANPYILSGTLHGFGFSRTDEIALKMGIAKDHPGRIRACLVDLVKREADEGGHTYVERRQLIRSAVAKLAFDTLNAEKLIRTQLAELCTTSREDPGNTLGDDESEEDEDGSILVECETNNTPAVALRSIYTREISLCDWFRESWKLPPASLPADQVDSLIREATTGRPAPNAGQLRCIHTAVCSRISVMSGGAGTGKSFTIATIYRMYQLLNKDVALAAPTGKAAKRMSYLADGAVASTIHRLLEYSPMTGWGYNKHHKLPYDLVIIDEVSMCDITLLWRLFSAVDFTRTQVLLVGDHNQLPPIGAGNVLRDILTTGILPFSLLTECIRAAGELKLNCNSLLDGKLRPTTQTLASGGREWHLIDSLEDPQLVVDALKMLIGSKLQSWGFDPLQDCQIITPYNKGKLGVNRLNAELQRVWQLVRYNVILPEVPGDGKEPRAKFLVGDKVMQIKNDYKLDQEHGGVMNGTQGILQDITRSVDSDGTQKQCMVIQFDDRPHTVAVDIGSDQANNLVLAYACTIHKVQGSEYPCVVAVIHKMHTYMLSRNLIYTAATRARKTAVLIGDKLGMRRGVRNVAPVERRTWMGLKPS